MLDRADSGASAAGERYRRGQSAHRVPVDPADPTGATVSLSLARLPATDPDARIGTLITNPGGPGGSGVEFLGNDGPFNDEVNRRFDIVSWDPRGVGGSAPLQCGSGFSDTFLSTDLAPRDAAGREALEASLAANVETCVEGDASLLAHIGTDAAVSDLEAIRLALGGDQITYAGFSYGTLIGLRYAERFPDGLRAMVLDGLIEPEANLGDRLVATAASLDRSLADIRNACGPDCPITGDRRRGGRRSASWGRRMVCARSTGGVRDSSKSLTGLICPDDQHK